MISLIPIHDWRERSTVARYRACAGEGPAGTAWWDAGPFELEQEGLAAVNDGGAASGQDRPKRRRPTWLEITGLILLLLLAGRGMMVAQGGPGSALPHVPPVTGTATGTPSPSGTGSATDTSPPVSPTTVPTAQGPTPVLVHSSATPTSGGGSTVPRSTRPTHRPTTSPGRRTPTPTRKPTPTPTRAPLGTPIVGLQSGKCIDLANGSSADHTAIVLFECDGQASQAISYTAAGELRILGKCLDATGQSTRAGTQIILYTCNGQDNQKWWMGRGGAIVGSQSNLCLDAMNGSIADGTPLQLWFCTGSANQSWAWQSSL